MRILKLFIIIIIMILGAVFAVLNAEPVRFNYYFDSVELPLSLILTTALGVGVVLGILSGFGLVVGLKRQNVTLKRRSRLVNEEIRNLRNLPLKEE
ncbi:MAG: LapA family protein [Chromatiales bacterium]|jgi:putative membrane protein